LNLGPERFQPGDRIVFRDRLETEAGKRVATANGECVTTEVTRRLFRQRCNVTGVFGPRTSLNTAGVATFTAAGVLRPFVFSVTGGSGRFFGANGELRGTPIAPGKISLTYRLWPACSSRWSRCSGICPC
jgi:hypothetical protein